MASFAVPHHDVHPLFTEADAIAQICKPLAQLDITYFAQARINHQGQINILCNNPAWVHHYLSHGYLDADIHANEQAIGGHYILWDHVPKQGKSLQLDREGEDFGLFHTMSIVKQTEKFTDYYHFSTDQATPAINQRYLTNLDQLELFILQFNDTVRRNKSLRQSYRLSFTLNDCHAEFDLDRINKTSQPMINAQAMKTIGISNALSAREFEIVTWLYYGKTACEIGLILNISQATVNNHIQKIKTKLGCYNQFQLGAKIQKLFSHSFDSLSNTYRYAGES